MDRTSGWVLNEHGCTGEQRTPAARVQRCSGAAAQRCSDPEPGEEQEPYRESDCREEVGDPPSSVQGRPCSDPAQALAQAQAGAQGGPRRPRIVPTEPLHCAVSQGSWGLGRPPRMLALAAAPVDNERRREQTSPPSWPPPRRATQPSAPLAPLTPALALASSCTPSSARSARARRRWERGRRKLGACLWNLCEKRYVSTPRLVRRHPAQRR